MRDRATESLCKLLEPCLPEDFLKTSWGKTHQYIRGRRGKFAELLPWDELNQTLEQDRLDFPRLRLAFDGKSLPASSYLRHVRNARQRAAIPRLLPEELTKQLGRGATLVLDAVDELFPALRRLAEDLEYFFHEHVQINAYAGWQTTRGFDLHFDDHDVFILQVAGRKLWAVYGMTKPYPLAEDRASCQKPDAGPLWEGMLEDGDLLYIPRGWWHVATPQAEATLHLTVGVHNRTGLDLVRWLAGRMSASASFRQDLPRFSSAVERAAHMGRLKEELLAEWDEPLLARFFEHMDASASPRPRLNLAAITANGNSRLTNDTLVCLATPRPIEFREEDGVLKFSANRKRWQFAVEALLILRALQERRVCSVSELCEVAAGQLDAKTVRAFLDELLFHGLIITTDA